MLACEANREYKKGNCPDCNQCRKCPPPSPCAYPFLHISPRLSRVSQSTQSTALLIGQVAERSTSDDEQTPLAKLSLLFTALGLSSETSKIPGAGFSTREWELNRPAQSRAKSACHQVFANVCEILCPSDSKGLQSFFEQVLTEDVNGPQAKTFENQAMALRQKKMQYYPTGQRRH